MQVIDDFLPKEMFELLRSYTLSSEFQIFDTERLANDHIISWSNEGDLVYDCFAGSGTTPKMAILNNRNWIASEISSEYCEIIKERIKIDKGLFDK